MLASMDDTDLDSNSFTEANTPLSLGESIHFVCSKISLGIHL